MKKTLMMLALAVALVPAGSAATMCTGLVITTSGGTPASCTEGVFTFSNFRLAKAVGFEAGLLEVKIWNVTTQTNGYEVFLGFSVNHQNVSATAGSAGFVLLYEATTATNVINGVDIEVGAASNIRITENVCSSSHAGTFGTTCPGTILASYNVVTPEGPQTNQQFFAPPTNFVSISKDIQFRNVNSSISDFTNSHHAVPEPGTMLLMGSALLGLAALRRRKQQ